MANGRIVLAREPIRRQRLSGPAVAPFVIVLVGRAAAVAASALVVRGSERETIALAPAPENALKGDA